MEEKFALLLEGHLYYFWSPPSLAKGTGGQSITESISGSVDKQEHGK